MMRHADDERLAVRREVVVRQHRALRRAGRAGRVDDERRIAASSRERRDGRLSRAPAAALSADTSHSGAVSG